MYKKFVLILFVFISSITAFAKVAFVQPSAKKQMNLLIMPISNIENNDFTKKVLPQSLTAADNSQSVVAKIIDNSLAYWWDHSDLKNTAIGNAADQVQNKMKAEVNLGLSGEGKTEHKLSIKLLAMQALAKLEYKGWIKAAINYDAKAKAAQAEILENLSNNKDLIISHSVTANENKSQLSLRWNW